ncbi:MAG: hypothetical protein JXO44_06980 [Clostridia bacterium]|nr:hypothetical protein [Clostridia bacterium]
MKRSIKKLVMTVFCFIGMMMLLFESVTKGIFLIAFAWLGLMIVELRQIKRLCVYCEPTLFRCGRTELVAEHLQHLSDSLLFYEILKNRMAYLEVGRRNVMGDYETALGLSEIYSGRFSQKSKALFNREICYAELKMGREGILYVATDDYRDDLIQALRLIQEGNERAALGVLSELREEEAGNVIFREVNQLMAGLLKESQPEMSAYYGHIAAVFYDEDE